LARDAAAVMPVGPRLHAKLLRDLPDGPRLLRLDPGFDAGFDTGSAVGSDAGEPGERTAPAGRPLVMIMGRLEDARLKGLELAAKAIGHAWALDPRAADWELLV